MFYNGYIWVDPKLDRWRSNKRSFASIQWFRNQVRYSKWIPIGNNTYKIDVKQSLINETITIRIRFTHYQNGGPRSIRAYVHVWGSHTIRSKKRRR